VGYHHRLGAAGQPTFDEGERTVLVAGEPGHRPLYPAAWIDISASPTATALMRTRVVKWERAAHTSWGVRMGKKSPLPFRMTPWVVIAAPVCRFYGFTR
jgi:hypothetical protein